MSRLLARRRCGSVATPQLILLLVIVGLGVILALPERAHARNRIAETFDSGAITTVGTDYYTICTVTMGGQHDQLSFTVNSAVGSAATTSGFRLQTKAHVDAEWVPRLADADFDSANISSLHFASDTGPHELAADGDAEVWCSVGPVYSVQLQAKVAADDAVIRIRGTVAPGGLQ